MLKRGQNLLFILMTMIAAIMGSQTAAQESALVSAAIREAGRDLNKLNHIIAEHEALLRKYPSGEFAPTIIFQLAELHEQKATLMFQQAMTKYEADLDRFDSGQLALEPAMPRISLSRTIDYCFMLLNNYFHADFIDKVFYKLAMAYLQEGSVRRAKIYFERIIEEFPQSNINLESHFRIAEFHFDRREYSNAIKHYKVLLEKWDNSYFDMSLYKLGWSYYNLGQYSDAISSFLYLIEDISLIERVDSQILEKSKADLRSEAIQYIASCFTEYGGPELAREFLEPRKDKDYSLPILQKMAELYQNRSYYTEAVTTYKILLSVYPLYEEAPEIYQRIIKNHELEGDIEAANEARRSLVETFGPGGLWTTHYVEGERHRKGLDAAQKELHYLGTFYQAEGQRNNRARDFHFAVQHYRDYLAKFPDAADAAVVNYYLAECYYSMGDYSHAAESYFDVVVKYDSCEYREESAFNRILCYYQLIGADTAMDSVTIYIDEFLNTSEILTIRVAHQSEINLLHACNDFILMFPDSRWLEQVMMKFAESLHDLDAYLPAVQIYREVMNRGTDNRYALAAFMNAGQNYYDGGYYREAEQLFSEMVELFPDSTEWIGRARKMALSSSFKIAEQLSLEGKALEAASLLSRISESTDDAEFRERLLYEAASQFTKANEPVRAALLLEDLGLNHPDSELADEALLRAAGLREDQKEWAAAANLYIRLSESWPDSKHAGRAMKNAALCYENLEDWHAAQQVYRRIAEMWPERYEERLESLFKCGEMYMNSGENQAALSAFERTVSAYQALVDSGEVIERYFAANAQFLIGDIRFDEYRSIRLSPNSKTDLNLKINKFNEVFQAFKQTLLYRVADWSTAASFKIGMAFEEFYNALMDSPPPPGLDEDELGIYTETLRQKARPYQERALETYKKNVEQAEANQIDNTWVSESRRRMKALIVELGLAADVQGS